MALDYKQKEPSKTERMLYELAMAQNSMEKGLWSTSTLVMALIVLGKVKPEEIADLMVNGEAKLKEYSGQINEAIKKLEEGKKRAEVGGSNNNNNNNNNNHHHGHDHAGHDHSGHDHSHEEKAE